MRTYPFYVKATYILLLLFLLTMGLSYTKALLVPISLSALLATLEFPIARFMEDKWKMHRLVSCFICTLILFVVAALLIFLLSRQIMHFAANVPGLIGQVKVKVAEFQLFLENKTFISHQQIEGFSKKMSSSLDDVGTFINSDTLSGAGNTFAMLAPIPFYVFFLLFYRDKFITFSHKITDEEQHYKLDQIIMRIKEVIQSYLSGVLIVVAIVTVMVSTGLFALGVPYALFLGAFAAVINIVPYLGIIIAALLSTTIALLTKDNSIVAVGVMAVFLGTHLIESNILTPNIVGSKVSINPLATIIALIIGEMLWGIVGMILFVPLLGVIKVVFDNIDSLQPYGYILGTEGSEEHQISFRGTWRRFRRLFHRKK
jgi:predicted PurR-regulated permease PerM